MTEKLSVGDLASIKLLFPEKYQNVLKEVEISPGYFGALFEITFSNYQDLYRFILMFDEQDFPKEKISNGFSIGICAKCPKCGQINMAGSMDFGLIKSNQKKLLSTIGNLEKAGEVICWCLSCLIIHLGSEILDELEDSNQGEKKRVLH